MVKSLVRFDHDMVITFPCDIVKAKRTNSYFRDVRDHRKLNMFRELESVDWDMITSNCDNLDEMIIKFYEIVWPKFDKCFTLIKIRTSSPDSPFMSPLVKHLLKQRRKAIRKRNTEATLRLTDQINKLIRDHQLNAVKHEFGSQKAGWNRWWSNINSITSRKMKEHTSVSAFIDPRDINAYFQSVNTDPNYTTREPVQISEGTRIPLLSINTVKHHLLNQKRSSAGPDNLPCLF